MRAALLAACLLLAAGQALAAPQLCSTCLLGVFDDRAMTRVTGTVSPFQIKTIYLGIRLGQQIAGLSSLQFEATYPPGFTLIDVTPYVGNAKIRTLSSNSVRVDWTQCVTGDQALFRVRILSFSSVTNAAVQIRNAVLTTCPAQAGLQWALPGGCYVLNPHGRGTPCATSTVASAWGAMKVLFR